MAPQRSQSNWGWLLGWLPREATRGGLGGGFANGYFRFLGYESKTSCCYQASSALQTTFPEYPHIQNHLMLKPIFPGCPSNPTKVHRPLHETLYKIPVQQFKHSMSVRSSQVLWSFTSFMILSHTAPAKAAQLIALWPIFKQCLLGWTLVQLFLFKRKNSLKGIRNHAFNQLYMDRF